MARRAFSLIELVTVVGIVAVLAALAAPRYADSIARYSAEAAARRIASDLDQARELAQSRSTAYSITFARFSYTFGPASALPGSPLIQTVSLAAEPYLAEITAAAFGSGSTVTFNGYGLPDFGGDIVVARGTRSYRVRLSSNTGKPDVSIVN